MPVNPETGVHLSGFTENWWVGLAMLHTVFTREHNYICDLLVREHPDWTDAQLYGKAKLINSALMAKIHTVEWTPAILPYPVTQLAMHANWYGLGGEELQEVLKFLNDNEILGGIVGSETRSPFGAVRVDRRVRLRVPDASADSGSARDPVACQRCRVETIELPELSGRKAPGVVNRIGMADLFYSFGRCHPGAITLHNYPKHLQNLRRDDGEHLDLAAVDIFRDRERGVPRYNQFRRLLHKDPVKSFEELTDNPVWREEIRSVYGNDLEKVEFMTGSLEPLPPGFGFSETAFRIFMLMASRRLKSDRFFTDDYRAEVYTEFGINYLKENSMLTVLKRHYPDLAPALHGVEMPSSRGEEWKQGCTCRAENARTFNQLIAAIAAGGAEPGAARTIRELPRNINETPQAALGGRVALQPHQRPGFNDGLIIPGTEYPLGTPLGRLRRAAATRAPLRGDVRVIVVLVDFSDAPMVASPDHFRDLFFLTGEIPTGSVREYFTEVTNGLLTLDRRGGRALPPAADPCRVCGGQGRHR